MKLCHSIVLLLLFLGSAAAISAQEDIASSLYDVAMHAAQVAKPGLVATKNITWERLRVTRLSNMTCPLVEGADLGREVRPYIMTIHYTDANYVIYVSEDGSLAQPCDPKFDTLAAIIPPTSTPLPTQPIPLTPTTTLTPTLTLTPAPTATALPAAFTCPPDFTGFLEPRVKLGYATARVGDGGSPNRMRDEPSVSGLQVGQIQPGRTINQVLSGPACSETYIWWFVDMDGIQGWTVESDSSDGGSYFLEPLEGLAFPTNVPAVASATAEAVVAPATSSVPGVPNTVTFNRYSVSYSDTLPLSNLKVNITRYAGDPPDAQMPGGPQPANTRFDLYTDSLPPDPTYNAWTDVTVRFYKTADAGYSYTMLQSLLKDRPALTSITSTTGNNSLPFLMSVQGIPALNARPHYIETANITGISYITYLTLSVDPIYEDSYIYTFQGISSDGSTYVSMVAMLHTLALPTADPDYETFANGFEAYLVEAATMLNKATADQFEPNLDDLDTFVGTITVK